MSDRHKIDIICIGDTVTDAFIQLREDEKTWTEERDGQDKLVLPYATKIPFESVEVVEGVGNSANAAVSISRLGLGTALVANVGDDDWGRDIVRSLKSKGVDTRYVRLNPGKRTNYHYVLWYKNDRTILIKHEEYDYALPHISSTETPAWVYLSSAAANSLDFHDDIADWLDDNPHIKLAFNPGTYQMQFGAERLKRLYEHTNILCLNREEAALVGGGNPEDVHDLFNKLHELGPKVVCITDGPDGSYVSDGENRFKMPNYPDPEPPKERTGAGDAYTSTFAAAVVSGASLEEAMRMAPINSMSVVQKTGAQAGLLTMEELQRYLRDAPDWYVPERM